jgi:glycerol-3-phosphate dehydrogenase (NAD(P)+)
MKHIGILGAGSWGTALGCLLAENTPEVSLWAHLDEDAERLGRDRENKPLLEGVKFPDNLQPTSDLAATLRAPVVLFVVPSKVMRPVAQRVARSGLPRETVLVTCTKGLELDTGKRMSEILLEHFPQNPVAVLSGPTHAEEVGRKTATAAVVGSNNIALARDLQKLFDYPHFRAYRNEDVTGIELGGALKNIYAIGAGISDGLELGDNAKAALVTRSLAEMIRLGICLGGRPETFQGLAGIGDLMVTCFSRHSRNRRFGEMLGQGKTVEEIRELMNSVAEGYPTTASVHQQARKLEARTPVLDALHQILYGHLSPEDAIQTLMTRDQRHEIDEERQRA